MGYRTMNAHKQQGVVLIAALIMVLVVSGVAVTLMSSSSIDMKVINAAQDYDEAINQAYADSRRAIYQEIKTNGADNFTKPNLGVDDEALDMSASGTGSNLTLIKAPGVLSATNCSRKGAAHSVNSQIKCTRDLRLQSIVTYGANGRHSVVVMAGIEQESL